MESHGRPVCADGHKRTHTDTHRQPQTSCVCWRTPMNVLCVLNRQPTGAKITRTVHGKGQRAESKDQRADMCTDGLPLTSCVPRGPKSSEQSTGRASVLSPRTSVLICLLMDSHRRPDQRADMCTDGQPRTSCTRTHTDSHGHPMCADKHTQTQPTWAKITQTVHGKGQRAESKDQHADIVLIPRTNVLICVLMDSHVCPLCADGNTRTHTRTSTDVLYVLMDTHERHVCADVMCVLTDTHGRPVCTEQTSHSTGWASVLSSRTNVLICVLMDSHRRTVCADGHTRTHTDSHRRPMCADVHTRRSRTAHAGQNHPNSPREGPAC
ncbi:unnamed protein product [Brassica rapa]|uniref:Uncharacterized protein n=1 Tax=Brassica campestris TaxID=3711 RepID=A0A8D9CRE7_BRACM|nr:unnamed protein product [Brassica rapa]